MSKKAPELSDDGRVRSGRRESLNTQCLEVLALNSRVVLAVGMVGKQLIQVGTPSRPASCEGASCA